MLLSRCACAVRLLLWHFTSEAGSSNHSESHHALFACAVPRRGPQPRRSLEDAPANVKGASCADVRYVDTLRLRSTGRIQQEKHACNLQDPRLSQLFCLVFSGYGGTAQAIGGDALFACESTELVVIKDIPVFSMCEHHMLPFYGKVHVAYLPQGKVLGKCP